VGFVNAVNLTDGLDGLATGVTLPVVVFFGVVSIFTFNQSMAVFSAAVAGGLLGFLIYNFYPAKVFMGDTGSLFLGGAVCTMAMIYNMPLMLVIVGFIYVVEAVSVMLQVIYFKLTHGKRLFRMSPIHHHMELSGLSEIKIVFIFTGITAFLCIIGYVSYTAIFV
jgi:phospho-N-acetylmuramoyl-pentapeptide-transferase